MEARACGGMREGEIRCGEGGGLWAGRTKEDELEGLEEIGKGFEWTRKAVVEKNGEDGYVFIQNYTFFHI